MQTDLSPIPPDDEPLCDAESCVKAIDMVLLGNVGLLAGMFFFKGDGGRGTGRGKRGTRQILVLRIVSC